VVICWQDFETGGLDSSKHSPLSFAMVFTENEKIVDSWYTQIRQLPLVVTPEAMAVNKLDLNEKGLTFAEFKIEYLKRLKAPNIYRNERPMYAGHNCAFDRPWLKRILSGQDDGCHYHCIDTMVLANSLKAYGLIKSKSLKLTDLCNFLGVVESGEMHNALTDATAAFHCFLKIRELILGKQRPGVLNTGG